jgi:hypothetical protein
MFHSNGSVDIVGLATLTNGDSGFVSNESQSQGLPEGLPFGHQSLGTAVHDDPTALISPRYPPPFPTMPVHPGNGDGIPRNSHPPTFTQDMTSHPYGHSQQGLPHQPLFTEQYHHAYSGSGAYPVYNNHTLTPTPSYFRPDNAHSTGPFPATNHHLSPPRPFSPASNPFYPVPQTPTPFGMPQPVTNQLPAHMAATHSRSASPRPPVPRHTTTPHPPLRSDPAQSEALLYDLSRRTEGYTVEQLEQVYAACMDTIWRLRHEWDRSSVTRETERCINRLLSEIDIMKKERQSEQMDI